MIPGGTVTADKLIASAVIAAKKTDALLKCNLDSVFLAVMDAATLGLTVHWGPRGEAALVPYKETCQLIIGYRGYAKLMLRSGDIRQIHADKVCERDEWSFSVSEQGVRFTHVPFEDEDGRGDVRHYYAAAFFRDGQHVQVARLSKGKADKIRDSVLDKISEDWKRKQSPYVTWPEEMGIKGAVRQLVKLVPSEAVEQALELEESREKDMGAAQRVVTAPPKLASVPSLQSKSVQDRLEPEKEGVPVEASTAKTEAKSQIDPVDALLLAVESAKTDAELDDLAKKIGASVPKGHAMRDQCGAALSAARKRVRS